MAVCLGPARSWYCIEPHRAIKRKVKTNAFSEAGHLGMHLMWGAWPLPQVGVLTAHCSAPFVEFAMQILYSGRECELDWSLVALFEWVKSPK